MKKPVKSLVAAFAALGALAIALVGCQTLGGSNVAFKNLPNPEQIERQQGQLTIMWRIFTQEKFGTAPVDAIPLQAITKASLDALGNQSNHVIRLGHSSHLLKLQGKYWLIDPVFSERVSPVQWAGPKRFHASPIDLEQLPPIEGVVLSHDHYDHLDVKATEYLANRVERYVVPLKVGARLVDMGVPKERITELDWWSTTTVGGIKLTATPSQHFSGRTLADRNKTLWASWLLESGNERIFYSGDSGYFPGFKEIGKRFPNIDLALMENGAYDKLWPEVHMTPEQSVQAFQDLGAKVFYSVHNSTFDLAFHPWRDPLERIAKLSKERDISLATPIIGEPLTIGLARENKEWWVGLK